MNRQVDQLGRIVLPKEFRRTLNIRDNELLNMELVDGKIVISKIATETPLKERMVDVIQRTNNLLAKQETSLDDDLKHEIEAILKEVA